MINKRIELIINTYCKGSKSEFAKKLGVTPSVIGNITGLRQGAPSFMLLEKIANTFPQINCEWLLTGRGGIDKKETQNNINTNEVDILKRLIKAQDKIIELQKQNAELTTKLEKLTSEETKDKKENTILKRGQ